MYFVYDSYNNNNTQNSYSIKPLAEALESSARQTDEGLGELVVYSHVERRGAARIDVDNIPRYFVTVSDILIHYLFESNHVRRCIKERTRSSAIAERPRCRVC